MFFEPNETPFDLRFWIFGIHVRVHPMFWLISVLMGWNASERGGLVFVALWVLCVFCSVLIHELGHVLVGRLFGSHGHIVLYSFGGLAIGSNGLAKRWQRIAVYLAGPIAEFLFFGLILVVYATLVSHYGARLPERTYKLLEAAYWFLYVINIFWASVNLLPIWPLDGGQAVHDLLDGLMPNRGIRIACVISLVVAGALAIHCFATSYGHPLIPYLEALGTMYTGIFFAMMAAGSYFTLQQMNSHRHKWDENEDDWYRD